MRVNFFGLCTALLLLAVTAQATYTPTYLPKSNYGNDGWAGMRSYTKNGVHAAVEYAVYDTQAPGFSASAASAFGDIGTGRYVYAYQAFNINQSSKAQAIATFELLGGDPSVANGVDYKNDGNGGIVPTNDGSTFVWTFEDSTFVVTKHSAAMVFSSDYGPTRGRLKLTAEDGSAPPTPEVPEPATAALLAIGAIGLLRRQKRNRAK